MKLLAIETATEACSAALSIDGEITERYQVAPRQHTSLILPMIDQLLTEAQLQPQQLDALAFGCGPGSFTGVRIATGVIQGIALGVDLPVAPVSTLAALAHQCFENSEADVAFTAMDARMNEVYWAVYKRDEYGLATLLGRETVGPAGQVEIPEVNGVGVGSGFQAYQSELLEQLGARVDGFQADLLPKASAIAKLGVAMAKTQKLVSAEQATPVYLRNNVAKKPTKIK